MGDQIDRPMCLRMEREKTDQDNDEQTGVDPEGEDWQREVQGGEAHWSADAERVDRAPESDVPEQQGGVVRHRR